MAAEVVVVVVVVVVENGSITGEVEFGPSDCDAESNRCEVKTSSVDTSIAVLSAVSFGSIPLLRTYVSTERVPWEKNHHNRFSSLTFEKIGFGPTFQNPSIHVAGAHSRFSHQLTI